MTKTSVQTSKYPLYKHLDEFLQLVRDNQVVIVSADTGSGKSTLLMKALLESGEYDEINVTSPTRTAAVSLASHVASLVGSPIGDVVGYQTAYERAMSKKTRLLYSTEGVELLRTLHKGKDSPRRVIVLDELQEWTANIEALLAFIRNQIMHNGWQTKVILMSATLNTEAVASFMHNSPVLRVTGKRFPLKRVIRHKDDFIPSIIEAARNGKNVLAFVYGKPMINQVIKALLKEHLDDDAVIYPFHGELEWEAQQKVFNDEPSGLPKVIVATNIAQTALTIPGIDVVVDSGLERHSERIADVETLTVGLISRSDQKQREGRAARTGPGEYIWCNNTPIERLPEYSAPDIVTSQHSLEDVTLKLASIRMDTRKIEFFHQPSSASIEKALKTLLTLGAIDHAGNITSIGMQMAYLPLPVRYARMVVEARKLNVLEDVAIIASIGAVGALKKADVDVKYSQFSREQNCDLLAELDLYRKISSSRLPDSDDPSFGGIVNENAYLRFLELRTKIIDLLEIMYKCEVTSTGNRDAILRACAAGLVENLYIFQEKGWYVNPADPTGTKRNLDRHSACCNSPYLLGEPKNISIPCTYSPDGQKTMFIIQNATRVDKKLLCEIAPHLVNVREEPEYDLASGKYRIRKEVTFNGITIDSDTEPLTDINIQREVLANWLTYYTLSSNANRIPIPNELRNTLMKNKAYCASNQLSYNQAKMEYLSKLAQVTGGVPNPKKSTLPRVIAF